MRLVSSTREVAMTGAREMGGAVSNGCRLSQTALSTITAGGEESVREKGDDEKIWEYWALISARKSWAIWFGGAISKDRMRLRGICHACDPAAGSGEQASPSERLGR